MSTQSEPDARRTRSPRACAGWQDFESPEPTCWPHGCERLDENGECPGWTPPADDASSQTPDAGRG